MNDHDVKIVVFTGFLSVVPARAGVIPGDMVPETVPGSGPRASGGDPGGIPRDEVEMMWSPRERG